MYMIVTDCRLVLDNYVDDTCIICVIFNKSNFKTFM